MGSSSLRVALGFPRSAYPYRCPGSAGQITRCCAIGSRGSQTLFTGPTGATAPFTSCLGVGDPADCPPPRFWDTQRPPSGSFCRAHSRIADLNQRAVQLTGRSLSYEQLQLERELTQKQYGLYVNKQEEARIRQAKDDARFANVTIAAHPQLPAAPTFPRPGLMLALALLVGLIVAAGMAAAAYLAEQRIYTPSDAAAFVPLLGTLDETPRAHLPPTHQLRPLRTRAYHETF